MEEKKSNLYEAYKPLRNHLRKVGIEESLHVIRTYIQHLQFDTPIVGDIEVGEEFSKADGLQKQLWMPEWTLTILTRELLINSEYGTIGQKSLKSWDYLANGVNKIKSFENAVCGGYIDSENILNEMSRIAHQQFPWQAQTPSQISVVRYYKIFNSPKVAEIVLKETGLTVGNIYLIGTTLSGVYLGNTALYYPPNIQIEGLSLENINKFLALFSCTLEKLIALLKSEQRMDDRFFFHFSSLSTYPIIRMEFNGRYSLVCPLPTLLLWRMTNGLYYEIVGKEGFDNAFGDSFQSYIGECALAALNKKKYKVLEDETFIDGKEKRTVDWIIDEDDKSALFVECKTKRLSAQAKAELLERDRLNSDLDIMAQNVLQIYKTIRDYKNGKYPQYPFKTDRKIYLLIVTLEDWFLFGNLLEELKLKVEKLMEKEQLPLEWLEEMPFTICSAQEFENLVQVIKAKGIDPVMGGKVSDKEKNVWSLDVYLRDAFRKEHMDIKPLFPNDFYKIFPESIKGASK